MPGQPTELRDGFALVPAPNHCLQDQFLKSCLSKWGMITSIKFACFSFVKPYHKLQGMEILQDMFQSHAVQYLLQPDNDSAAAGKKYTTSFEGANRISFKSVPATITNMSLFDRLMEHGIARKDGMIIKCMEDYIDGFQVSDKLRDLLLNPESSNVSIYSPVERAELLFCIFEHLCLGGAVNQFEDDIAAYLQASKLIYKDLVR
ncbi:hypothetical protein ABBQ32_004893 [Trebouxia sp. C0010 RCD-2024]